MTAAPAGTRSDTESRREILPDATRPRAGPFVLRDFRRRPRTTMNLLMAVAAADYALAGSAAGAGRRGPIIARGAAALAAGIVEQLPAHGPAARRVFRRSYALQVTDMIRTWSATGLPPVEYYKALLARHLGGRELGNYVDLNILWRVMIRLQDDLFGRPSVNINNKKAFGAWCRVEGLPHPREVMVDAGGRAPAVADLAALGSELIVKPQRSSHSRNVTAWRRRAEGWTRGARMFSDEGFARYLLRWARLAEPGVVVQERLTNHADIADLAGGPLSTLRVVTLINETGEPEVVKLLWRMALRPAAETDAKHAGGVYWAARDLSTGAIGHGVGPETLDRQEMLTHHPVQGSNMVGFRHPCWPEARRLVLKAHRRLDNELLCGWDVATTPAGPMLIEVNAPVGSYPETTMIWDGLAGGRYGQILAWHCGRWLGAHAPADSRWQVGARSSPRID